MRTHRNPRTGNYEPPFCSIAALPAPPNRGQRRRRKLTVKLATRVARKCDALGLEPEELHKRGLISREAWDAFERMAAEV
jgi:hypothetical protein